MKKQVHIFTILFLSAFFIFSCGSDDDGGGGENQDQSVKGLWTISKRSIATNYTSIDESFNYYFSKQTTATEQEFTPNTVDPDPNYDEVGALKTYENKDYTNEIKSERYRLRGDSIFVYTTLTNNLKMKGTYQIKKSTLYIYYAVAKSELDPLAMEVGIDPNLIKSDIKGILTVTNSR